MAPRAKTGLKHGIMVSLLSMVETNDNKVFKSADRCDVAVVGGGISGSIAAIHLAREGFKVVLFEKERAAHHKVCGEFLSGEGLPYLKEVGIDPKKLGAAEITTVRLHGKRLSVDHKLPMRAFGLSRQLLDEKLLESAEASGVDVRRGVFVKEIVDGLESPGGSILLETSDGEVRAQRLVVATGKSDFKSLNEREGRDSRYVGFKMHLRLKPSMMKKVKKHVDLFVFDRGYGGLSPIEGDLANFSFLIEKKALAEIGTDWDSLAAHIGNTCWAASHYLDGAEAQLKNLVSIANIPYGFVRRAPAPTGVFFVGDQMAVIPSLTGDGMTIAMMTGKRAAEAIVERVGGKARLRFAAHASTQYQREVRTLLRPQIEAGLYLHRLFRKPLFIDVVIRATRRLPALFDAAVLATRIRVEAPRRPRLPFRKVALAPARTSTEPA